MTQEELPTILEALHNYGHAGQVLKTMEECGELITALSRYHHSEHRADIQDVITELADVSIMVDQMALEFGLSEFNAERARKLQRLRTRIDKETDGNKD